MAGTCSRSRAGRTRIVLRGSSGVAIASALNRYLEDFAGVNISIPLQPIRLPRIARVPARIRVVSPYQYRYFFNYCTFSYSMAWWDWDDWQRMIDWMALKGINLPLAATGQEGSLAAGASRPRLHRQADRRFPRRPRVPPVGLDGQHRRARAGRCRSAGSGSHVALETQILARERSLGMKPVLQGFTGHVPESIKDVFPAAKIHRTGDWSAGFSGTWFLDPLDPLFQRIGTLFIKRQTELFGTDHLYAADSFNEINPPIERLDLPGRHGPRRSTSRCTPPIRMRSGCCRAGSSTTRQSSGATRRPARCSARCPTIACWCSISTATAIRCGRSARRSSASRGSGTCSTTSAGRSTLNGDLPHIASNLDDAVTSPARGRLAGLGMMMEGLGTNPIVPDYVMDLAWREHAPRSRSGRTTG